MTSTLFDGMALTVEVGFSTTAGSGTVPFNSTLASITWTDVTSYVREVSTSRGRSSELDSYSTGSCSVVLDNRTRLFDPEYSAGTYYGKLTPLRPIRIRVTPSGGTIRSIFMGFIDQWPQSYTNPSDATVTVTASDGFKILNVLKLPSYWNAMMTATSVSAWYPLADFAGSDKAFEVSKWTANSATWNTTTYTQDYCTTGPALIANEPAISSSFDGMKFLSIVDPISPNASSWSVEFWIQTTENTDNNYGIWNHLDYIHGGTCGLIISGGIANVSAQFGQRGTSNAMTVKKSSIPVNDGLPHHVAMIYQSDPSYGDTTNLYVDGTLATTTSTYTDIIATGITTVPLGYPISKSSTAANNFPWFFRGSIAQLVMYSGTMLSEFDVKKHNQVGKGTYRQGERTDQRITILSALAGWMSDGLDLDTGDSTVLGIDTTGHTLLEKLKECETAEQGRLFMSVDGKIKFVNRESLGSGKFVSSQQTFSDAPTAGQIAYSGITLTYDDRYIFNDVTTVQPSGNSFNASDSTSQGQYFARTSKVDNLIVDTAYLLANTAISRLNQYKQPAMRIDSMTIKPRASTTYQSPCVTLDIGDRVTITRTPQGVGSEITKPLIIEGVKHTITPDDWTVTFNTSPANNAPFVLDSTLLGVLDTNILGY